MFQANKLRKTFVIAHNISTCSIRNSLTLENMNPYVKKLEYAVRGPIVIKAQDLEKQLKQGAKLPFSEVVKCNIGDCHATGQQPISFLRQVLTLTTMPQLLDSADFPEDAKQRARRVLDSCGGGSVGAYSQSTGVESIREDVASFIADRDGIPTDTANIFLSTGASEAVKIVLQMMATQERSGKNRAGIMVPIPQYPLYSATNAEYGAHQIGYFLDEEGDWGVEENELERAIAEATPHCRPSAIVVINPGNPTGQVLSAESIRMVIEFARRHDLLIMADEVYQFNVYPAAQRPFLSFKKALHDLGSAYTGVQLASFMSASKGYMGECGLRGGYCELYQFPADVQQQLYKLISARLCSSVLGQAAVEAIVRPPTPGEPSYETWDRERRAVLTDLAKKGALVTDTLNSLPGFSCNTVQGAMYAFPSLQLPPAALQAAQKLKQQPDFFYCSKLLEETGVCVVPGSGFGQKANTHHFRITILPQVEKMHVVMQRLQEFHTRFMKQFQ